MLSIGHLLKDGPQLPFVRMAQLILSGPAQIGHVVFLLVLPFHLNVFLVLVSSIAEGARIVVILVNGRHGGILRASLGLIVSQC